MFPIITFGQGGVHKINGITGNILFAGVSGIFIDRQGQTIYIGNSGVNRLNSLFGELSVVGSGTTRVWTDGTTIQVNAPIIGSSGVSGIASINSATGPLITLDGQNGIVLETIDSETIHAHVSGHIDRGGNNFTDVGEIEFRVSQVPSGHIEGRIYWNNDDHTLNLDTDVSGTVVQVGQETIIRGVNKTGGTLFDGTVVYVSGVQGNRPKFWPASNSTHFDAHNTIAVVTNAIDDSQNGYATVIGLVRGIDTSSWNEGDLLYCGTSGNITNIEPTTPLHRIKIGYALNSTNNGSILVKVDNGQDIHDCHDITNVIPIASGNLLVWNGSYYFNGGHSAISGLGNNDHPQYILNSDFVSSGYEPFNRNVQINISGTYNVTAADKYILANAVYEMVYINFPAPASMSGYPIVVKKIDSMPTYVRVSGLNVTIDGYDAIDLNAQNQAITVLSDGTQYWII